MRVFHLQVFSERLSISSISLLIRSSFPYRSLLYLGYCFGHQSANFVASPPLWWSKPLKPLKYTSIVFCDYLVYQSVFCFVISPCVPFPYKQSPRFFKTRSFSTFNSSRLIRNGFIVVVSSVLGYIAINVFTKSLHKSYLYRPLQHRYSVPKAGEQHC